MDLRRRVASSSSRLTEYPEMASRNLDSGCGRPNRRCSSDAAAVLARNPSYGTDVRLARKEGPWIEKHSPGDVMSVNKMHVMTSSKSAGEGAASQLLMSLM